jgi:phosphoserine phosphatase
MVKLICLDMDGVLTQEKNFWFKLHDAYGTYEEGRRITKQYLHNDYDMLIKEVVGRLWKDKDEKTFLQTIDQIPLMPGIAEFFSRLDNILDDEGNPLPRAIISSGPYELAQKIADLYGADYIYANQLLFEDGKVSGKFNWPVGAGTFAKAKIIEDLCAERSIDPKDVLYVGDSPSDVVPFKLVGTSIAFNNPPRELVAVATYVIATKDLRHLIPLLDKIDMQG